MATLTERKQSCWFCGATWSLKPFMWQHVGGSGPVMQYQCQNEAACKCRQEAANAEWKEAMFGLEA